MSEVVKETAKSAVTGDVVRWEEEYGRLVALVRASRTKHGHCESKTRPPCEPCYANRALDKILREWGPVILPVQGS